MKYRVMVLVGGKWEEAKRCGSMGAAQGFAAQLRLGGIKAKVERLKDGQ